MINALHIVWNPSEGFDLGFFMLRFYSLSWVLAFGLGWYIMKPIFTREQESVRFIPNRTSRYLGLLQEGTASFLDC